MSSVLSSEQFRGEGLRDPGHGRFRDTCAIGLEKTKEMLKAVLVETPARTNAKGEQYQLRSESVRVRMPKTRVRESDLSGIRLLCFSSSLTFIVLCPINLCYFYLS